MGGGGDINLLSCSYNLSAYVVIDLISYSSENLSLLKHVNQSYPTFINSKNKPYQFTKSIINTLTNAVFSWQNVHQNKSFPETPFF